MSYTYNVTQAKQLLEKAGWITNRDGIRERNEQPLFFKILIDDTPDKRAVASYIVDNLKKIDIIAQVDAAPSPRDFDNAIKNNNYDAIIFTVQGALNDPDQYVNWHSSYAEPGGNHYNFANWRLNRADQLLEASRNIVSQEERRKLYLEWQTIWADEMPSIPLYSSTYNYVVSKRVGGLQGQNLKVVNVTSDRLKDISSRYIFTSTRFGS